MSVAPPLKAMTAGTLQSLPVRNAFGEVTSNGDQLSVVASVVDNDELSVESRRALRTSSRDNALLLNIAHFFTGEQRDGICMLNMQAVFFLASVEFEEKDVGFIFLCLGLAQILFQVPAGWIADRTRAKKELLIMAVIFTVCMTLLKVSYCTNYGEPKVTVVAALSFVQGAAITFLPVSYNSIALGLGGMEHLPRIVSRNEIGAHAGVVLITLISGFVGETCFCCFSYPLTGLAHTRYTTHKNTHTTHIHIHIHTFSSHSTQHHRHTQTSATSSWYQSSLH